MSDELPENSLVLQALHAIRNEAQKTNARLETLSTQVGQTNERLDALKSEVHEGLATSNARIDQTNERLDKLGHLQVEAEVRVATELTAVVKAVTGLRDMIAEDRELRGRVDKMERRLDAVEQKLKQ
jgi:hypothetical protein